MSNKVDLTNISLMNDLAFKVNERVLTNLQNRHIGSLMTKSIAIGAEEQRSGYLRVIKYKKIQVNDSYDPTGVETQKMGSTTTLISPTGTLSAAYEFETLDTALSVEGLVSSISNSLALSIALKYDALYLDLAAKKAVKAVDLGDITTLATDAEKQAVFLKISDAKIDLESLVNNYYVGLDKMDTHLILNPKVVTRLGIAISNRERLDNQPLNQSTEYYSSVDGYVTKSILLNNKIDKDADGEGIVSKGKGLDLTKIYGFLVHREALLVRACVPQTIALPNPENGNPKFIFKSRY
jgi:hypothetical protein